MRIIEHQPHFRETVAKIAEDGNPLHAVELTLMNVKCELKRHSKNRHVRAAHILETQVAEIGKKINTKLEKYSSED